MKPDSELYERMRSSNGGLVITVRGEFIAAVDTSALSEPTLLVSPVREALKEVSSDGFVVRHVDRETAWRVDAYYLDDRTSHILGAEEVDVDRILERVNELDSDWRVRPIEELSWGDVART